MTAKPSVGRIVHYVAYGTPGGEFPAGVCRAAMITDVYGGVDSSGLDFTGQVALCAINPTGLFFNLHVRYDPDKAPGTWHWPEREA